MRTALPTSPTSRTHDSERAYFGDLAAVPRFERDQETELARAVVRTRHAYWAILLSPAHLQIALGVLVERAKEENVRAIATSLLAGCERSDPRDGAVPTVEALLDALEKAGDEHAASDAILASASSLDAEWATEASKVRAAFLRARNRFVSANLRLVVVFANRFGAHLMPLVDRIQEGNIGLMKAVDRFDPERGVRFSTYASWWIRHSITRALSTGARTVRIPPQIQVLFAKAERARRRLAGELGRDPETHELASAVGCEPERLEWALQTMQLRSVSFDARPDGDSSDCEVLSDETSLAALESVADNRDRERAMSALRDLPVREQDILHERFAFPGASRATLHEIGRRHGVSRERARQLQNGALDQLRRKLEPRPCRW